MTIWHEKSKEFKKLWKAEIIDDCSSSDFRAKFKDETIITALNDRFFKTSRPSLIWSSSKNCWVELIGISYELSFILVSICVESSLSLLLPATVGTEVFSLPSGAGVIFIIFGGSPSLCFHKYILGAREKLKKFFKTTGRVRPPLFTKARANLPIIMTIDNKTKSKKGTMK